MKPKIDGRVFDPQEKIKPDPDWDRRSAANYIAFSAADEFSIGQVYEDKPAARISCQFCGGTQFIMGAASYFTAIKCPTCQWEVCLHEG